MDYYNNQSSCFYPFLLNSICLKHSQRDLLKTALRSWHLCTMHPPVSFHFTQVKSRFFQDLGHYLDPAHLSQLISHHALDSHCSTNWFPCMCPTSCSSTDSSTNHMAYLFQSFAWTLPQCFPPWPPYTKDVFMDTSPASSYMITKQEFCLLYHLSLEECPAHGRCW